MNEPIDNSDLQPRKVISEKERLRRLKLPRLPVKHDMYKTAEYWAWLAMKQRCSNPNHPCYRLYGARGIKVCDRWQQSFVSFIEDMGRKPTPKHCLERINNDLGYCPENCAWKTHSDQMRNTRRTIKVSLNGKSQCLKDWCSELGIPYDRTIARIGYGYSPIRALFQQPHRQNDWI